MWRAGLRLGWQIVVPVLVAAVGWGLVAGVYLFGIWLANLWLLAWPVIMLAWAVAAVCTAVAVGVLWRRPGPWVAVPVLGLCLLAPVGIRAVDWASVFVHGYYRVNRDDFAAVAALARDGAFGADDYYGDRLPPELEHLSINKKAARIGPGATAVFLPAWAGIPDGAVGYAYLGDGPTGGRFDCFADPCQVRWSLGDGWYWLD
ncbi:hypothetical protein OHA72_28580 [Dactylosporangium sp. NBC_01737]|uniref:hypothetical protein n=1 Tax=Dactylosporangium sp. NBC_01737 TaxID=2975959 RepID=UPI002E0F6EEB|nr:hypothetical protein OHA72_28580 [Dactylosporangium sp. NBC_01737]